MVIAYAVVAVLFSLALFASARGKLTDDPRTVGMLDPLGVSATMRKWLAAAEIAGGLGLLAGIALTPLGVAAAACLVLYFVGAVGSHLRVQDRNFAPAAVLGLVAVATLTLRLLSA